MKFIATDEIHEISAEEREIADIHKDHEPDEHVCRGCFAADSGECWDKRHGEETDREGRIRPAHERDPDECKCFCHHVADQCRMALASLESDGNVMYRLVDEDGWSVVMPSTVHDMFQNMPEDVREEAMRMILSDAKSKKKAQKLEDVD